MLASNLTLNHVTSFLFCDITGWRKISAIICFAVALCASYSSLGALSHEPFPARWGNERSNRRFNVNSCDMSKNLTAGKLLEIIEVVDSCYDWSWLPVNCETSFPKYIGNDKFSVTNTISFIQLPSRVQEYFLTTTSAKLVGIFKNKLV